MSWTTPILTKEHLPYVPFGTTHTIGECYARFIEPLLPKEDVVRHWHGLLLAYVAQPSPILFIRRYASASKTEYDRLRRGFLTLDPTGFGYAYCDNYFPQLIFAQVLAGRKPSLEELNAAVANRSFPVSAMLTAPENRLKTFGRTIAPPLGALGWKLSHLYSVNQGYNFDYQAVCATLFPRGEYSWWDTADKVHRLSTPVSVEDRTRMTAHFLRAVHPANYFLSPSKRHQPFPGTDVGENALLIAYVRERFRELYGDVLTALEPRLLLPATDWAPVTADTVLTLTVQTKSTKPQQAVSSAAVPKRIKVSTRTTKAAYPITFSTAANPTATAQEFTQALLQQRKATITRTFTDGTTATTSWNAGDFVASSNLISNIRGKFRGAESEKIAALRVAIAY